MQTIDFLPPRYQEAVAQRHSKAWRIVVLCAFGALVCLGAVGQHRLRKNVEAECNVVRDQYHAAQARAQRVDATEQSLAALRTRADLLTYMRHPWPRTQILASVLRPLPATVVLRRVRITHESSHAGSAVIPPSDANAAIDKLPPSQADLDRLRRESDAQQTVVMLEGSSTDDSALHQYLARLGDEPLFASAELVSLETNGHERTATSAQFAARVVVKPGYGQRGGPTASTVPLADVLRPAVPLADTRRPASPMENEP